MRPQGTDRAGGVGPRSAEGKALERAGESYRVTLWMAARLQLLGLTLWDL